MTNDPTPTETREPVAHQFETSGEAYDRSQTDDEIRDGDVLIVVSEDRAAVLVEAWPVIVIGPADDRCGPAFHHLDPSLDWVTFRDGRYAEAAAYAVDLMDGPRGSMAEAEAERLFTAASANRRRRLGIGVGTKTPTAVRPGSMTVDDLVDYLIGAVTPNPDVDDLLGLADLADASTFAEAGVNGFDPTTGRHPNDEGFVVTLTDGSAFEITVRRTR